MIEEINKRRSVKRRKINISTKKVDGNYCLIFSLSEPNSFQIIVGSSDLDMMSDIDKVMEGVTAIFYTKTLVYTYLNKDELKLKIRELKE